jgi:Uncharacterised protein family (UPF0014)
MIVSGAMLAAGLTLRRLREDAEQARPTIEARLCLGLSAHEAFLPHQRSALRTALLPAIDSTKVVGLISLPGAMTGLILAGVDPLIAIRYQIVVMYMLLAATALAALATARLAEHALFDHAHRLAPLLETPRGCSDEKPRTAGIFGLSGSTSKQDPVDRFAAAGEPSEPAMRCSHHWGRDPVVAASIAVFRQTNDARRPPLVHKRSQNEAAAG